MNYRKLYSENVCKVPNGFDIHHIDLNRKNNDIKNLLMLPRPLHQQYHRFGVDISSVKFSHNLIPPTEGGMRYIDFNIDILEKAVPIIQECDKWHYYKYYCLSWIPNIYNIKIEDYYE